MMMMLPLNLVFAVICIYFLCLCFSLPEVPNIRWFFVLSVLLLMAMRLLVHRRNYLMAGILLWMTFILHWRIFYGPFFLPVDWSSEPPLSMSIIIMTTTNSTRLPLIRSWIDQLLPHFEVTEDDRPLAVTVPIPEGFSTENCTYYQKYPIVARQVEKYRQIMIDGADTKWVLVLEDDATPLWPHSFRALLSQVTRDDSYDLVFLDSKMAAADWLPDSHTGTCAVLFKVSSLPQIVSDFYFTSSVCDKLWGVDALLGQRYWADQLRSFTAVSVKESRLEPSTLGYGRKYYTDTSTLEILIGVIAVVLFLLFPFGNDNRRAIWPTPSAAGTTPSN